MKVIIDTNVIISHLLSKYSKVSSLMQLVQQNKIQIFTSVSIWIELKNTISKDKVKDFIGKHSSGFLAQYKYACSFEEPTKKIEFPRDPKDAKFLELAQEIKADILITGDKDLLELKEFNDTKIVDLNTALELLQAN
jgi:uncharacterized protein